MTTNLYVDQLEQELIEMQKNRQLVREIRNLQEENLQLCRQLSQDCKVLVEVMSHIREAKEDSLDTSAMNCSYGLEVFQRAPEKVFDMEQIFKERPQ